jgi:hypothetical protein
MYSFIQSIKSLIANGIPLLNPLIGSSDKLLILPMILSSVLTSSVVSLTFVLFCSMPARNPTNNGFRG